MMPLQQLLKRVDMGLNKNIESFYPLTPMQQGILFHSIAAATDIYFEQFSWSIQGNLNVTAFRRAWQHILERYEVPRTGFVWEGIKEPVQVVYRQVALPWQQYDWLHLSPVEQQQQLEIFLAGDRKQGFELKRPPLMRLTLIHLSEHSYNFTWSHHHLLFDGWSGTRICREVFDCYKAFSRNQGVALEPIRPYRDYIVWLQQQDLSQAEAFWRQLLKGFTAPTKLWVDKGLGLPTLEQDNHQQKIRLSTEKTAALRLLAQQHQLTLNILVQGAWALLLSRYSGQDDVVFGATTSGRPPTLAQVESMVGLFINTLPIRVKVPPDACLLPWVKQIQIQQIETLQYEYSPLVQVQRWSEVPRGLPLFESIVVFENYPVDAALRKLDLDFEIKSFSAFEKTNYPLNLLVNPSEELLLRIAYDDKRFDADTITQMLGHLQTLFEGMIANRNRRLSELALSTAAEQQQLLVEWNATQADYPQELCIHQWFEAQVTQTPDAVAVMCEDQQLTYRELNTRANQLAHYLNKLGVKPEVLVGLCVERSPHMLIGLLGILKAGGAYVPLDPAYPQERLAFMLQDAQIAVLLTQQFLLDQLPNPQAQVVCLDTDWTLIAQASETNPFNLTEADNLAYLIYTSGSTGTPKGVMISHRSLVNYTAAVSLEYAIAASDRVLQFASISFDVAAEEIFPCLVQGATLVLRTDEMLNSVSEFLQHSRNLELTVLNLPTAFWHQVTAELSASMALPEPVRLVIIGGERALPERLATWQQQVGQHVRLVNCYGPTETTIGATMCDLSGPRAVEMAGRVPIGKPLQNIQTYVLDSDLQPVPIGAPGELYLGGVGVARGYLHRPELTAKTFIPNPYSDGERLYKTGDLVRYRADGNIEYLGRMDAQVKIRGFRIELGEIAVILNQHPAVRETVVLAPEKDQGDKRLVAYFVPAQDPAPAMSELRRFLKQKLPEYMVPAAFVQLEGLPLTPNGKLDHNALPEPDTTRPELEKTFVAPCTPIEMKLSQIWAQVLGVQQVGIYDNFFELGGDSILTIQIVARANQAGLQLTPKQLFEHQNVAELAAVALAKQALQAEQGVTGASLTPIQKWFLEQNLPDLHPFNQAVLLEARQTLDLALLEQALRHLLLHHDALCLRFEPISGWQQVQSSPDVFPPLTRWDFSALSEAEQTSAIEATATELKASLNLSTGPLVRAGFFDLGVRQPSCLLLVIHRLVVDRVSWRILLEDLQTAYQQLVRGEAVQLPATASFQQWSRTLREYLRSNTLQQEKDYWLAESWKQSISLPVDWPGGENTMASVDRISSTLSFQETQALLEDVPKAYNTQTSDVLLTALLQAFTQWTGERTLLVDLAGHGRDFNGLDLSRTVGWFTTVFPVLLNLKQAPNPGDALKGVKEQLRSIPNQGIGYGVLRYLSNDQDITQKLSVFPQAEVMFNYLSQAEPMLAESSLFGLAQESSRLARSLRGRHLLEINGWVSKGQLQLNWSYSQAVHHRSTIETLAESFVEELQTLITHCQSVEAGGFTPSDFSEAQLSQQELDQFLAKINRRR